MQYRLRTLMILLAIGPPVLAGAWLGYLPNPANMVVIALPFWPVAALQMIASRSNPPSRKLRLALITSYIAGALASGFLFAIWWSAFS